jgi:aspartate aminotransferase
MLRVIPRVSRTLATRWSSVPLGPPDAILGLNQLCNADPSPNKINLGVGAYRDEAGKPLVLRCVKRAEAALVADPAENHEYAGISGIPSFTAAARDLAFADAVPAERIVSCQTVSGTGALRVLATFLARFGWASGQQAPSMLLPEPTWGNHRAVLLDSGFAPDGVRTYRYWDAKNRTLDFEGMCEDLRAAPEGTAVLLHACAHNPTGQDPTEAQWAEISAVCRERNHIVFFDMAYQGFASGDLDRDAAALRSFARDGIPLVLSQSFAKNLGLYGERTGALHVVTAGAAEAEAVDSQLKLIVRPMYSNPPVFGAKVVDAVLRDPALTALWHEDLAEMAARMTRARTQLRAALEACGSQHDWSHAEAQTGMFFFSGLSKDQVMGLRERSIYCTADGRMSVCGINPRNVEYLAKAIHEVTK